MEGCRRSETCLRDKKKKPSYRGTTFPFLFFPSVSLCVLLILVSTKEKRRYRTRNKRAEKHVGVLEHRG